MGAYRKLIGRVVLVLVVFGSGYQGARLGVLSTPTAQASHNFADVPDSAFYHDYVDFLVNNEITGGCQVAPPLYCPDQPVTRGQMAVFLEKTSAATGQTLWAAVAEDGTLVRGFHATASTITNTTQYEVDFDRDVSNCAYSATVASFNQTVTLGLIPLVQGNTTTPSRLRVSLWKDSAGNYSTSPFHVTVLC